MDEMSQVSISRRIAIALRVFKLSYTLRPWPFYGYILGVIMEITGTILSIYATAKLASLLAEFISNGSTEYIWFWLWVDIFALTLSAISFVVMEYMKRMIYFRFVQWSINTFLGSLNTLDIPDFYENSTRNMMNKVGSQYIWRMPNLAYTNLELIYAILRFLAITVIVAQIAWWLIFIIALFLVPTVIGEGRLAKMQWFVWDSKGDFRHVFWGLEWVIKRAKGQMEIRTSQAKDFVMDKITDMNQTFYREQEARYRSASRVLVPTKILESAGTAIGLVYLLKQFLDRVIPLETYFFLSGALMRVGGALNTIFGTLSRMQEDLLFADSFFEIADAKPTLVDNVHAKKISPSRPPTIEFQDVTFAYPHQDRNVFKNFNLTIKAGEHIALVGQNGAGKTTLIKLLLRFYKPDAGKILLNGIDISDVNIESWYSIVATLFQEFNQYPLSIEENVSIGRSKESKDNALLKRAISQGGVDDFSDKYVHGLDTVLDSSFKKGVEPSGGQWQRVALARAFYRDAKLLILDEPTAAIDANAEYEIFNSIFSHYSNRTAIIVSHRFSTVRRADRVIVIDNGKIVESGSHKELMKNKSLYHEMFTKQAEGYKE